MPEKQGFRPRTVDERILELLVDGRHEDEPWGRSSPGIVAEELDHSSEYIVNRLSMLQAAGYVDKLAKGVYEITREGIEVIEASE